MLKLKKINSSKISEKKKYTDLGIYEHKLVEVSQPSVLWSKSRKILLDNTNFLEVIKNDDGNYELSIKNNQIINVRTYSKLTDDMIDKINNSEGIFIYQDDTNFRFEFIP